MGRYSHLSIEKREDIMVCWRDQEGIKPDREGGLAVSRQIKCNNSVTSGSAGTGPPRQAQGRHQAQPLEVAKAHGRPRRCSLVVCSMRDKHWSYEQISAHIRAEWPSP